MRLVCGYSGRVIGLSVETNCGLDDCKGRNGIMRRFFHVAALERSESVEPSLNRLPGGAVPPPRGQVSRRRDPAGLGHPASISMRFLMPFCINP